MADYQSDLVNKAVQALSVFPGIGKKTAFRMALYLIQNEKGIGLDIANSISDLVKNIRYCEICHNISENHQCNICSNELRSNGLLCVVADIRDVIAIENTRHFRGRYHVLGGLISPMEGIGQEDLHISDLVQRCKDESISEIIIALSATMEGETTAFYISKMIDEISDIKISSIARGISVGGELEYADELTLSRSLINRIPFNQDL